MAIIDLPPTLRISDRSDPHLSPLNRSGGMALNGVEQVIGTGAFRWVWRAVMLVRNAADARSWRMTKALLQGRLNYLRATVCDRYRLNRREIGAYPFTGPAIPYSDDETYSDGTGFALEQPGSELSASAAADATTVYIDAGSLGDYMSNGLFFSINDWLYQVTAWTVSGDDFALTFTPPLRDAASIGTEVLFSPRSLWVLASDDDGQVDLNNGRFGAVTLNLIEAIGRDT